MTQALHPIREKLRRKLQRTLRDAEVSLTRKRVLLLCSGGADSVALVDLVAGLGLGSRPQSMVILQLDHRCREQDAQERAVVDAVAQRHGVSVTRVTRETPESAARSEVSPSLGHDSRIDANPESAAPSEVSPSHGDLRRWRYSQAARVAQAEQCEVVLVGHHADDQLESILMSITGAGASGGGLRGMLVARNLDSGCEQQAAHPPIQLARPLLAISRSELLAYLEEQGLQWFEDPSNGDARYQRTRVRTEAVPAMLQALPDAGVTLTRAARRAQLDRDALADLAQDWIARTGTPDELSISALSQLGAAAQRAVVAQWIQGHDLGREVSERNIAAIVGLPRAQGGATVMVPGACVWRDRYVLRIQLSDSVKNLAGRT